MDDGAPGSLTEADVPVTVSPEEETPLVTHVSHLSAVRLSAVRLSLSVCRCRLSVCPSVGCPSMV